MPSIPAPVGCAYRHYRTAKNIECVAATQVVVRYAVMFDAHSIAAFWNSLPRSLSGSKVCNAVGTNANPNFSSGCHWNIEPPSPIQP